jgi:transposase
VTRKLSGVVRLTLESTLAAATHWSTRTMAKRSGLSQTMISRIWRAFTLQPHRVEGFKLSKDPLFIEKVPDIVGLYLDPPERELVLCVDEKAQIQALDRSQPLLPLHPGQAERRTPDYLRHGTINLFAALDAKAGTVIGELHQRRRAVEFRSFLATIDLAVPGELELHLILDHYGTHKTPAIKRWLLPRFHLHFTPTGGSWLNLVERWFALLTEKQLRRGVHRRPANWSRPSALTSNTTTAIPNPSSGPRPLIKSLNRSPDFVNEFQTQDTSFGSLKYPRVS